MIFQTDRLNVRPLHLNDLDAFHKMQSNQNVMRYTTRRPRTFEENQGELQRIIACYGQPENDFWVWAVERKSDKDFVGTAALVVNEADEYEIGFRFLETFWGRGYGTEIVNGLVDYALKLPEVGALVANVDRDNVGSVKVLERSPLVFEREYFNEVEKCMDRVYRLKK